MRLYVNIIFIFSCLLTFAQNTESPSEFLGYPIGTKYSRHHQIESYFRFIASKYPKSVQFINYGNTEEGRNLFVTIISSEANMSKLNQIQQQNLDLVQGKSSNTDLPSIVWLSYNVHGNEPASSEAAMLTLYELVNSSNLSKNEWLNNTIVIIDPCLNPDGRDRYVNWYNNAVGKQYNSDPQAREHEEPWPSGRTNHYNFDLNRDWAWQTQIESQQRAKLYQQWYPHVHVDYHEQGCDEPYYFAPAANPIHTTITPWQKEFQVKIGNNHASYFDKNAWLFFTKERFDLLYPSYGDTYPMYNGAIGMTYEQGGIGGGLGIIDESEHTLTLVDRVQHHLSTSLSTIEVSSQHSKQLVNEFKTYFEQSRSGKFATYQSYILTASSQQQLNGIVDLFNKNNISYSVYDGAATKGYHFQSKKEIPFINEGYSILIDMHQPHSVLANVLLEPATILADSNTYDITAWSLPFAYGISCYGFKNSISPKSPNVATSQTTSESALGYLIPYDSFESTKLLAQLLKSGLQVRYTEQSIIMDGKSYPSGSLIVLKTNNEANWKNKLDSICKPFNINTFPIKSGLVSSGPDLGSPLVRVIPKAPKIAMLTGDGVSALSAGEVWNYFDQQLNYPITQLLAKDAMYYTLENYQVVILPNGSFITPELSDKLFEFTSSGGTVIALENSSLQLIKSDKWGVKQIEHPKNDSISIDAIPRYGNAERDVLKSSIPGAIFKVYLDETHPLAYGLQNTYYDLKQNTDLYELSKEQWNVGTLKKDSYVTGFVGSEIKPHLTEGVVFGEKSIGSGSFIFMADSPLFRNFWERGLQLMGNSLFFHGK